MTTQKKPCSDQNGYVEGVPLREYVELLVEAKTNEIKVQMSERLEAVHTAYERHEGIHKVIGRDMEHLNELRQEVTQDRDRFHTKAEHRNYVDSVNSWMSLMGKQISGMRGQVAGALFALGAVVAVVQILVAIYA